MSGESAHQRPLHLIQYQYLNTQIQIQRKDRVVQVSASPTLSVPRWHGAGVGGGRAPRDPVPLSGSTFFCYKKVDLLFSYSFALRNGFGLKIGSWVSFSRSFQKIYQIELLVTAKCSYLGFYDCRYCILLRVGEILEIWLKFEVSH